MKKLTIVICVLATVLALTGVAWASPPEEKSFALTNYTTIRYEPETLPSGRTKFEIEVTGDVTGALFDGSRFSYVERGNLGFDPDTGKGTWKGTNHATMTMWKENEGGGVVDTVVIKFQGQTRIKGAVDCHSSPSPSVFCPLALFYPQGLAEGTFTVLHGTGCWAGIHGHEIDSGKIIPPWNPQAEIQFRGKFHTDP